MANTTVMQGTVLSITLDGSTDWEWDSSTEITSVPGLKELSDRGKLFIKSISFDPNAAGDAVSIRGDSLTGPVYFHASGGDTYDQRTQNYDGAEFNGIYIEADDVTSDSSSAKVIIVIA